MDPITTSIVMVLGKYALDKGGELAQEVGPQALEAAKEMFSLALNRQIDQRRRAGQRFICGGAGWDGNPDRKRCVCWCYRGGYLFDAGAQRKEAPTYHNGNGYFGLEIAPNFGPGLIEITDIGQHRKNSFNQHEDIPFYRSTLHE